MRYIYRTPRLKIIYTYLMGGQVDWTGDCILGFPCFTHPHLHVNLKNNGAFSEELIKKTIIELIDTQYEADPFYYYNAPYRFKIPCEKNLNILAKRIKKQLEKDFND
jgi:hypothetical protein